LHYSSRKLNHLVSPYYKLLTIITAITSLSACSGGSSGGSGTVCRDYATQIVQSNPNGEVREPEICEWSESSLTLSCAIDSSTTVTSYASTKEFVLEKDSFGIGRFIDSVTTVRLLDNTTQHEYSETGLLEKITTESSRNTTELSFTAYDEANRPVAGIYSESLGDANYNPLVFLNRNGATITYIYDDEALTRQEDMTIEGTLISSVLFTFDESGNLIKQEYTAIPIVLNPPTTSPDLSIWRSGGFEYSPPGYFGSESDGFSVEYTITATDEICFTQ
jgi:hypothetical protein